MGGFAGFGAYTFTSGVERGTCDLVVNCRGMDSQKGTKGDRAGFVGKIEKMISSCIPGVSGPGMKFCEKDLRILIDGLPRTH